MASNNIGACRLNACSYLEVTIPSSKILNTNQITRVVKLEIDGKELKADLYLFYMKYFDVTLTFRNGQVGVTIRYFENEVIF